MEQESILVDKNLIDAFMQLVNHSGAPIYRSEILPLIEEILWAWLASH